jgi:hypothetical protein
MTCCPVQHSVQVDLEKIPLGAASCTRQGGALFCHSSCCLAKAPLKDWLEACQFVNSPLSMKLPEPRTVTL